MSTTTAPSPTVEKATDFPAARKAMIDSQLRTSGVNDAFVLAAMGRVAREDHVPATMRGAAYIDRSIRLDKGGAIAPPLFYGRLLEEANVSVHDDVLVVDNGSGYLPALIEETVASVDVVSPAEALKSSRKKARYSLLLVDGAAEEFPDVLAKRLKDDARIVTGLVERGVTRLATGRLVNGKPSFMSLAEEGIPVIGEFAAKREWKF